jgi:hypothetical protein
MKDVMGVILLTVLQIIYAEQHVDVLDVIVIVRAQAVLNLNMEGIRYPMNVIVVKGK